jgi:hypothetical protein
LGAKYLFLYPFCVAVTTLLADMENGFPAAGYDLSPLAVLVSRVKTANYKRERLQTCWQKLQRLILRKETQHPLNSYSPLVQRALPGRLLPDFERIYLAVDKADCLPIERDFFRLAVLSILPRFSHAIPTGGWLSWVRFGKRATSIPKVLCQQIEVMLEDLQQSVAPRRILPKVALGDARELPDEDQHYSAIITSPPYPNRHDYTRVFGVELMFGFLDWNQTRQLRYQSFHSHPEAHPIRPNANGYFPPRSLVRALGRLRKARADAKVLELLEGYFLDMYLCLREMKRVCRPSAKLAIVVGNAQYSGTAIPVDELTAEIGEQAGLSCRRILAARYRGNSAQQMGKYGRKPSRESVVLFH